MEAVMPTDEDEEEHDADMDADAKEALRVGRGSGMANPLASIVRLIFSTWLESEESEFFLAPSVSRSEAVAESGSFVVLWLRFFPFPTRLGVVLGVVLGVSNMPALMLMGVEGRSKYPMQSLRTLC